jgi:hypothetical protein
MWRVPRSLSVSLVGLTVTVTGCPAHVYTDAPGASSTEDGGGGDDDDDDDDGGAGPTPTSAVDPTGPGASTTASGDESTGTTGTTDAATGSTTAPVGDCGDGHLDPGEGCDLTYAENKDDGACTKTCQNAHCGDGLVWAGQEQCATTGWPTTTHCTADAGVTVFLDPGATTVCCNPRRSATGARRPSRALSNVTPETVE